MWIATEYGISRFTPATKQIENYFFSSYTLGNVYSENTACVSNDGKLLFGTNYGLVVLNADKIVVLDEGRIAGIGTHSELMDKGGEYADMFNVQAQYYIDNNESEVAVNA